MLNKVVRAIEKYGMLDFTDDVTVALSGGADSVCLLYVFLELKEKYGIELSAVHINHMLRGDESDRDELFVTQLCKKLNVPLSVRRVDVNSIAKSTGESIELAARNVRYSVFKEIAQGVVATAHSADDNLETLLYNITRGSGLKGVCGIPPKRDMFIRPLIFCSRSEIEAYLKKKDADFVTDSSNLTDDYTRNVLRHKVVPVLKKINPVAEQTVANMCANLREDEEFLFSTAKKIYTLCIRENFLDAQLLRIQHAAVIKRVIALYLAEQFGIKADALHLENCKEVLLCGGRTSLCKNKSVVCIGDRFTVLAEDENILPKTEYKIETKKVSLQKIPNVNNLFLKNAIDCGKINGSLTIRTRMPSDKIRLNGRNCTKSLKKLFNELKIPNDLRDILPVAADQSGVVWIYGVGVDERACVDGQTDSAIEFVVSVINKS